MARLEDMEAIRNLKAMYARFCDQGYDADRLAALFTADAVWESNLFGPFEGRKAIWAYFRSLADGGISWAFHLMVAPIIEVEEGGAAATGTWYLLDLATFAGPEDPSRRDPVIATARYDDAFAKQHGEWRFTRIRAEFFQVSNLAEGWVRQPFRPDVLPDEMKGSQR
ncbi:MAG: nuclear transport factor 2 family protein [Actinomycetota bacterium]